MDGSQKEGDNFLNLFQKEEGSQKGGFPQKRGVQTNGNMEQETYGTRNKKHLMNFWGILKPFGFYLIESCRKL